MYLYFTKCYFKNKKQVYVLIYQDKEFLSLEINPDLEVFPTAVRYYEIDSDGYQNLIWEFIPPVALEGDFVNAKIGDVDGDGSPELVLVMNLTRFEDNSTPHVFVAT